ncbi:MAG: NTP transferase domain-containing protein [Proteobacteria bacterium]|nr:NTP transferase domain-containing protein [Pseudomonadota bacterium]NIS71303.1 NTP transferase domain-containing protein [Pseudomonadota bacterium]
MASGLSKAVVPAGGLGTRISGLTGGMPKEMLLIGHRPMIAWCIEEAFRSGIQEMAIVLNQNKQPIRDYLTCLRKRKPDEEEGFFYEALQNSRLRFIEQPMPRGSGDAIYRCRTFVGDEPFVVMMPDFVLFDSRPALKQMVKAVGDRKESAVGFLCLDWREAGNFGNVGVLKTEKVDGAIHGVTHLSHKRPGTLILQKGEWVSKAVGRLILHPDFFDVFDAIFWEDAEELDDVPVIQRLVEEKRLLGIHLEGSGFDVGNPQGYHAANAHLRGRNCLATRGLL